MNTLRSLNFLSIVVFAVLLFLLCLIALDKFLAPVVLFLLMLTLGSLLIVVFSNKDEILLKVKLFFFFFSLYLLYALLQHYLLLNISPTSKPFIYVDENTFFNYSYIAVPYVFGDKHISEIFMNYDLGLYSAPLHVVMTSLGAYLSIVIDGMNAILVQKLLSPFLGGMFMVVLYATLQHQFSDRAFALKATLVYGMFSAVFIYTTVMIRDIDVALAYMIAIYLFLQPNSYKNFFLLLLVSYATMYLRIESGFVLFGVTLLYAYLHIRTIESKSLKYIFYILILGLITFVILLMYSKIYGMITETAEARIAAATASASDSSIGILLNKLPFGISQLAKVLFSQIQTFPFMKGIVEDPRTAISGVFWPFIFIMMLYGIVKKDIRVLLDEKVKYLLILAITILFLMSGEPMMRRMMSVYPIMYIVSLYTFLILSKYEIKRTFFYYLFGIIALNVFYYLLKI